MKRGPEHGWPVVRTNTCTFSTCPSIARAPSPNARWETRTSRSWCSCCSEVQPHQIYLAGDLSDPHGTHRVCAEAILKALGRLRELGQPLPEVLLYRGAWQEYELHEIDIAVPLSPGDLLVKRKAIFMHESQKDEALFPGADPREFWQRAEDRNKGTAERFNQIGLPEFFAIEAFVRWNGQEI